MRFIKAFRERLGCANPDEVFDHLISTLKDTITQWDYFVNWARVLGHIEDIELDLHILDYLVGKQDIERAFVELLRRHPRVARLLPVLIACRQREFNILTYDQGTFRYRMFRFEDKDSLSEQEIQDALEFAKSTGFLRLLQTEKVKSVVDYVIGVEVGLDSNARKNRGGQMMERIVQSFVESVCDKHGFRFLPQATARKVREQFDLTMTVDRSNRQVDFAVYTGTRLYLIETNFYGGGGSKLKATAGEYQTMFDYWKADGHEFIWITDGKGWRSTQPPLREAFDHIDYLLNLDMVAKGLLEDILLLEPAQEEEVR